MDKPAAYANVRRQLHLLLILYANMTPEQAVAYNPHGFRHMLVTAGQQLKHHGVIREEDLDYLGHWSKGSSMPRSYDSSAGVTEMAIRTKLLTQIRLGWRPSPEGSLPSQPILEPEPKRRVGHRGTKRSHVWNGGRCTLCKMWTCGSPDDPVASAVFVDVPKEWRRCNQ